MINYLLLLQFPLLYCITVITGLVVYGSDFESYTNWLYFLPLLVMPVLTKPLMRYAKPLNCRFQSAVISVALALLALAAARELHFVWWDEHSLAQAVLVTLVGIFSFLISQIAAVRLVAWHGNHQAAMSGALLILGASWILAFYYPMAGLLTISLLAMLSLIWSKPASPDLKMAIKKPLIVFRYLIFLLMLGVSLTIWDFQVNSEWALHLALVFVLAVPGCLYATRLDNQPVLLVSVMVALDFLAAIIWPPFIINPLYGVVTGISLGLVLGAILPVKNHGDFTAMSGLAVSVVAGMVVGYLFYANLALATWRGLLILPLVSILLLYFRSDREH